MYPSNRYAAVFAVGILDGVYIQRLYLLDKSTL